MSSSDDSLKRCPRRASILLIGSTGVGKSATINHLLQTGTVKGNVVAKTGSSEPVTKETLEYLLTIHDDDKKDSDLTLGIIDTPGLNDPRGKKQDGYNLSSMKKFLETHPLYSKTKCYPNLIFLLISVTDDGIDGNDSHLANTLLRLQELGVVDQNHPNVVVVLTFCCAVSHNNVPKWEAKMEEKKNIISHKTGQILGIPAPTVVLLENNDDYELEKDEHFTLLPNDERQPQNLYEACQKLLEDNEDHHGLSTFNACLANPEAKKLCTVEHHRVVAMDASKYPISEFEEDLLYDNGMILPNKIITTQKVGNQITQQKAVLPNIGAFSLCMRDNDEDFAAKQQYGGFGNLKNLTEFKRIK